MKFVGLQHQISSNRKRSIFLLIMFPIIATFTVMYALKLHCNTMHKEKTFNSYNYYGEYCPKHESSCVIYGKSSTEIFFMIFPWVLTASGLWFAVSFYTGNNIIENIFFSNSKGNYGIYSTSLDPQEMKRGETLKTLKNLSTIAGIPTPKLKLIDSKARSAFAAGYNQKTYTIYVTKGLIYGLSKNEMRAVLAHELSHIKNKDTLFLMIGLIFTGFFTIAIGFSVGLCVFGLTSFKSMITIVLFMFAVIAVIVLAPGLIMTMIIRFMISRKREYLADASSIEMTSDPMSLVSALRKLEKAPQLDTILGASSLMIVSGKNNNFIERLFSSHPSIESRIKFLEGIACKISSKTSETNL